MRILDDYDPLTGMWITFNYNHSEDKIEIGHWQDCTAILEDNKRALNNTEAHSRQAKEEWAHYAKVPNIVQLQWLKKYGVNFNDKNHWKQCLKLMEDPEYKFVKRTNYVHDR